MEPLRFVGWVTGMTSAFVGWLLFLGWYRMTGTPPLGLILAVLGLIAIGASVGRRTHLSVSFTLLGGSLICLGMIMGTFTNDLINAGSGQDAVGLGAWVAAWLVALLGCLSIVVGAIAGAVQRRRSHRLT